jgi:hypothetical protein
MATYWCDPYLEATTQGNGTTDTSTKNGTYAAPFSLDNLRSTSNTTFSSVNGVTISDNDEIRFKGLPFSTLFESYGNAYVDVGTNDIYATLKGVTGNSAFLPERTLTKSNLYAFQNSDISSYLPNWTHPLFFGDRYGSPDTEIHSNTTLFGYAVLNLQLGYTSASSTGMEVFRLKDTYYNRKNLSSYNYYWFSMANEVKLSAGWTSETVQDGYSVLEAYNNTSYRYFRINENTSSKTHYDCERLIIAHIQYGNNGNYNNVNCYIHRSSNRSGATDHVAPMIVSSNTNNDSLTCGENAGDTTVYPYVAGSGHSTYSNLSFNIYNNTNGSRTVTLKNYLSGGGSLYLNEAQPDCTIKIGNLYSASDQDFSRNTFANHSFATNGQYGDKATYEFISNSVYFLFRRDSMLYNPVTLMTDPDNTHSVTYGSGLKKPGIAPLDNLNFSDNNYGPEDAGTSADTPLFQQTREISANNTWFTPSLSKKSSAPIQYGSLAKLTCNGNDYRTTAHNIKVQTDTALSSSNTTAPEYKIWSSEHNDYDGNPISIISDPYTAGASYGALMYNDIIGSTSCLVGQFSGTTGGASNDAYIPLELAVPSYTAGSSNLRVTVSAAYANGGSGSQQKIRIKAHHRDTTQSNNFRGYTSSDTTISSSDPASPTTATLNLTNVPTSGQEDITSVIVGIRLQFASNTNIQKFYITNAAIETY